MKNDEELAPLSYEALDDIKFNRFDVSSLLWRTKDGQRIALGIITDSHLRNIALMLIGMSHQTYNAPDALKIRWLTAIKMEWEKRMRNRKRISDGQISSARSANRQSIIRKEPGFSSR